MKIFITYLVVGLAFAHQLMAQGQVSQVDYFAAPGQRSVHTSGGNPVANGNEVRIGAFNPGFDVTANWNNPAALSANWNNFGSTNITTIFGQAGRFTGSSSSTDPFFGNKKIYLWIFETDGAATPAADFSNVNEYGLFSATLANWTFSPDPAPNNTREIYSNEVNQPHAGFFDPTHLFLFNYSPVPEPSVLGLLSVAIPAIVLALRKRRSSR